VVLGTGETGGSCEYFFNTGKNEKMTQYERERNQGWAKKEILSEREHQKWEGGGHNSAFRLLGIGESSSWEKKYMIFLERGLKGEGEGGFCIYLEAGVGGRKMHCSSIARKKERSEVTSLSRLGKEENTSHC